MSVILALDIGTSSTRSAIYDAKGERVLATTAQVAYPLQTGPDGRAELRPADIDRAVARVFATTLKTWRGTKSPAPIAAIGVSCFWHSLLGLDAAGRAITPIYTWADSRCRARRRNFSANAAAKSPCTPGPAAWRAPPSGRRNCSGCARLSRHFFAASRAGFRQPNGFRKSGAGPRQPRFRWPAAPACSMATH